MGKTVYAPTVMQLAEAARRAHNASGATSFKVGGKYGITFVEPIKKELTRNRDDPVTPVPLEELIGEQVQPAAEPRKTYRSTGVCTSAGRGEVILVGKINEAEPQRVWQYRGSIPDNNGGIYNLDGNVKIFTRTDPPYKGLLRQATT